ncbi:MAG TPA: Ig-like domain-containing protein, partial [Phycisphaerae bacterium]|nr:Ig-like domain-containing protein [Phycisphaerae bacterium]HQL72694.1 Ig-like domain-containing protein [Phycisphaerae bacterium]
MKPDAPIAGSFRLVSFQELEPRLLLATYYAVTDLGTLGGDYSRALGLNDDGLVIGYAALASGDGRAFVWESGSMTALPTATYGDTSAAYDISGEGRIVGRMDHDAAGGNRGFLYNSSLQEIPPVLAGYTSLARGVNDSGLVVGYTTDSSGNSYPFIWDAVHGSLLLELDKGTALAVNEVGTIAGKLQAASGYYHPTIWKWNVPTDLTPSLSGHGEALGVNDYDVAVGWHHTGVGQRYTAFRWSAQGGMTDLGTLDDDIRSTAWAVNNDGQIVGSSASLSETRAFVYDAGQMYDLNGLLGPDSPWWLECAYDINDEGQIVGGGYVSGSANEHAFLLTPDHQGPSAVLTAANVTIAGGDSHTFSVTYSDAVAVDVSTLDDIDIRVTGPGGFNRATVLVGVDVGSDGKVRTATYRVTAPGGSWDAGDNGLYSVMLAAGEVRDIAGNGVAGGSLGTFAVSLAPTPTAELALPPDGSSLPLAVVNAGSGGKGLIEVTYFDHSGAGLNAASITDAAAEFTLTGAGAAGATANTAPVAIGGNTYRYTLSGPLGVGPVTVNFQAGTWADNTGALNAAQAQSFTVILSDSDGPRVVTQSPTAAAGSLSYVDLTFNELIKADTFTPADVSIVNPSASPVAASSVTRLQGSTYRIAFASQSEVGVYALRVGPAIQDLSSNAMNQDADGTNGEAVQDVFAGQFELTASDLAVIEHLPAGTEQGQVEHVDVTFTQVLDPTTFTPADVSLYGPAGRVDIIDVSLEGLTTWRIDFDPQRQAGTYALVIGPAICNQAGEWMNQDGDRFAGEAGEDVYTGDFSIARSTLQVVSHQPTGWQSSGVDHVDVTFSEAISAASFTVDDVTITGPGGAVSATSIQHAGGETYRVLFPQQTADGIYNVCVGPDIQTPLGEGMNQDLDALPGEAGDDAYAAAFGISTLSLDYTMVDVGVLPGGTWSYAYGLNNQGQVVGVSGTASGAHAFLWQDDQLIDLGTAGGDYSAAYAINDAGQIFGLSRDAGGTDHAVIWNAGPGYTDLGAVSISLGSINAGGDIVAGAYFGLSLTPFSTVFPGGTDQWHNVNGLDLGDGGTIVGYAVPPGSVQNEVAVTISGTSIQQLAGLGGTRSRAQGSSASGAVIAGYAGTPTSDAHACVWTGGSVQDIHPAGDDTRSYANDANDAGWAVGKRQGGSLGYYAFVWDGLEMKTLFNDTFYRSDAGWGAWYTFIEAMDVNNLGEVVGTGQVRSGSQTHGFYLRRAVAPQPTAELTDPADNGSILRATLNQRGWVTVTFLDDAGVGIDKSTITDAGAEFRFTGPAAGGVQLAGAPELVSESSAGVTYRYRFTGSFAPGLVDVEFIDGAWADTSGSPGQGSVDSFTVGLDPDQWDLQAPYDNTDATATVIVTDGTVQTHNLHTAADVDWVTFTLNTSCGVVMQAATSGLIRMTLYQRTGPSTLRDLGSCVVTADTSYPRIARLLDAGTYLLKIEEFGNNVSVPSYDLSVTARSARNHAILFAGGVDAMNNHSRYYDRVKGLYETLVNVCHLDPANIYILYADGTAGGVDRSDGQNSDMSFATLLGTTVLPGTQESLISTITLLADPSKPNWVGPLDHFLFWSFDHGDGDEDPTAHVEAELCGWGSDIPGTTVAVQLNRIHAAHSTYIHGQCFSGGILDFQTPLDAGEFGAAACRYYEVSYGDGFVWGFETALAWGFNTTHWAFRFAHNLDPHAWLYREHPWMIGPDFPIFLDMANVAPVIHNVAPIVPQAGAGGSNAVITYDMLKAAARVEDGDGDAVSFVIESVTTGWLTKGGLPVIGGRTTLNFGESLEWVPPPGASGDVEAFTVTAFDGLDDSPAPAGVTVRLDAQAGAPDAVADTITIDEDDADVPINVLANDSGLGTLSIVALGTPLRGLAEIVGTQIRYTPAGNYYGEDIFSYVVTDGSGLTDMASVRVIVEPVEDAPEATGDSVTIDNDGTAHLIDVLYNDREYDGQPLTLTAVGPAQRGTAVLAGSQVQYTPPDEWAGLDSFTYTISDGQGNTDTAQVLVTVTGDFGTTVLVGTGGAGSLTFTDADGTKVTVRLVGASANVVLGGAGITVAQDARGAMVTGQATASGQDVKIADIQLLTGGATAMLMI